MAVPTIPSGPGWDRRARAIGAAAALALCLPAPRTAAQGIAVPDPIIRMGEREMRDIGAIRVPEMRGLAEATALNDRYLASARRCPAILIPTLEETAPASGFDGAQARARIQSLHLVEAPTMPGGAPTGAVVLGTPYEAGFDSDGRPSSVYWNLT